MRDLTQGSILLHYRKLAVPAAIGMLFGVLYNVVDFFFAGQLSTTAQAGLTITFQLYFVVIAVAIGIQTATSALVGSEIGKNNYEDAGFLARQALSFCIFVGLAVGIVMYVAAPYLLVLFSEPGAYRSAAIAYIRVVVIGAPIVMFAFACHGTLLASGETKPMSKARIAEFLANLILNPLFIFGIPGVIAGMGFHGIAVSTLTAQAGTAIYLFTKARSLQILQGIDARELRPCARAYRAILAQALPTIGNMLIMVLSSIVIQTFLKEYGVEAVAAYGSAIRIEQIFLLPAMGISSATLAIVSQNYGVGVTTRLRQSLTLGLKINLSIMGVLALSLWFSSEYLIGAFSDDPKVILVGVSYLRVEAVILPAYACLFTMTSFLQGIKRPGLTLPITIYRQIIAMAGFIYLFAYLIGFGLWGVWVGIAASVGTGFLLSAAVVYIWWKKHAGSVL